MDMENWLKYGLVMHQMLSNISVVFHKRFGRGLVMSKGFILPSFAEYGAEESLGCDWIFQKMGDWTVRQSYTSITQRGELGEGEPPFS